MIRMTTTRGNGRRRRLVVVIAATGMLTLAGCSAGVSGGAPSTGAAAGGSATVNVHNVSGHADVLATADGRTLYASDQESGRALCTSKECTAVWVPLTVGVETTPTGQGQLSGMLGTLKRPDGTRQVTLHGKPLYTFSFDHGAGEIRGDNQKDSFGGTQFTWHVVNAAGAPTPSGPTSPSPGGGYGY